MEHRSRTKLVTAVVLVLVFGSGVLLGYAADSNMHASTPEVEASVDGDGTLAQAPRTRRYVYEQMERTADQDQAIEVIIRSHQHLMNQLHRDFDAAQAGYEANFDALVVEVREAIAQVFPPDQRAEYRELLAAFDQRREEDRVARDRRK